MIDEPTFRDISILKWHKNGRGSAPSFITAKGSYEDGDPLFNPVEVFVTFQVEAGGQTINLDSCRAICPQAPMQSFDSTWFGDIIQQWFNDALVEQESVTFHDMCEYV